MSKLVRIPEASGSFWERSENWPLDSQNRVFIARALQQLGMARFKVQWTGDEPAVSFPSKDIDGNEVPFLLLSEAVAIHRYITTGRRGEPPSQAVVNSLGEIPAEKFAKIAQQTIIFEQKLIEAETRFLEAGRLLAQACAEGWISTCLRPVGGGEFTERLPPAMWNTENWVSRICRGQMNQEYPFDDSPERPSTHWIFVDVPGLRSLLSRVSRGDSSLTPPKSSKPRDTSRVKRSDVNRYFEQRVQNWPVGKPPPSEILDIAAALQEFPGISRSLIRQMRRTLYPREWLKHGPRKPKPRQ